MVTNLAKTEAIIFISSMEKLITLSVKVEDTVFYTADSMKVLGEYFNE